MPELNHIGNYEILLQLNPERNSRTYKVKHKFTNEILALKLVFTDDQKYIDELDSTFKKLSKGFSRLKSPYIANFKEYFVTEVEGEQCFAIVIDFFPGKELSSVLLAENSDISKAQLYTIFDNISSAIEEAHGINIVDDHGISSTGFPHGDVMPNNILINDQNQTKLLDFKLSNRHTFSEEKLKSRKFTDVVPEQRESNVVSKSSDIFQLGFLLNFLFAENRAAYAEWQLEKRDKNEIKSFLRNDLAADEKNRIANAIFQCTRENPKDRINEIGDIIQLVNAPKKEKNNKAPGWYKWAMAACFIGLLIPASMWVINQSKADKQSSENTTRGVIVEGKKKEAAVSIGEYHALIISNNEYQHLPKLNRPIKDANRLEKILTEKYSFAPDNITRITNASRNDLYDGLEEVTNKVGEDDNLVVFYAGHGQLDGETGYWIPVEGREKTRRDWLSNAELKKYFNSILAKNVLLISDACFGGSILRDINTYDGSGDAISSKKSRIALTSGSLESVPDQSVFIDNIFWYLENNQDSLVFASQIYSGIREAVVSNTTTDPAYGPIRDAGHQGGDFFLLKKK